MVKGKGAGIQFDIIRLYILLPWSLDLFIRVSFQLNEEHIVLQPLRRIELIVHIAISVLPGNSFSPESSEAFEGKVPCRGHNVNKNVPKIERV